MKHMESDVDKWFEMQIALVSSFCYFFHHSAPGVLCDVGGILTQYVRLDSILIRGGCAAD